MVITAILKSSYKVYEYSLVLAKVIWGRSLGKDFRVFVLILEFSIFVWLMMGM